MKSEKFLKYFYLLCYLKTHSPEYVSRKELADKFFSGNLKTCEKYCTTLRNSKLVSSKTGVSGGYTYDPCINDTSLTGQDINKLLNELTYKDLEELNKVNLAISDNSVIIRLSKLNYNGLPLLTNLKFNQSILTKKEEQVMIDITDAIRLKHKIKINYISSTIENEKGCVNVYEIKVCPINFTIYNGVAYLNAYYERIVDSKPCGYYSKRNYVVNRIESVTHLEGEKFEINEEDIEILRNKFPYELYDSDPEIEVKICLKYEGFNCFNRVFKNYYSDLIDYRKKEVIIPIKTKSYRECCGNLLALGITFDFLDNTNKVAELYRITLIHLLSKITN